MRSVSESRVSKIHSRTAEYGSWRRPPLAWSASDNLSFMSRRSGACTRFFFGMMFSFFLNRVTCGHASVRWSKKFLPTCCSCNVITSSGVLLFSSWKTRVFARQIFSRYESNLATSRLWRSGTCFPYGKLKNSLRVRRFFLNFHGCPVSKLRTSGVTLGYPVVLDLFRWPAAHFLKW